MRGAPRFLIVFLTLGGVALASCGGGNPSPPAECPSGLGQKSIAGTEMCVRSPVTEAQVYDDANETASCGDPQALSLGCFATPPVVPRTPETVTIEGFIDTFGLEKSTTAVTVQVLRPDGTVVGTATADAAHRCGRTKTLGTKTQVLAGYTIPNVPTNALLVIRTSGAGFRNTYIHGKYFSSGNCQAPQAFADDACHEECFTRSGSVTFRYDTNIISDATWNLIPLTAGYSRGIAPGNAAFAGQIHDCNDNRIRNAAVAFSQSANAKLVTYFNGNCEDPTANNALTHSNRDSLYAVLDAARGKIKVSAEAMSGGAVVNLGAYDVELYPDSVSLLTFGPPVPTVAP
jgi:hypothetical protein